MRRLPRPWAPVERQDWDLSKARHLVRRLCFGSPPDLINEALADGPHVFIRDQILKPAHDLHVPQLDEIRAGNRDFRGAFGQLETDAERRQFNREDNQRMRAAELECQILGLHHARQPGHAALENWVHFLSNVFVISANRIRNPRFFQSYLNQLRQAGRKNLEELASAIFKEPGMLMYLDSQSSTRNRPNENFPRELFELFLLGEGEYGEPDILEAARAFTGYRQQFGDFNFNPRLHDSGVKEIFGKRGNFDAFDVIRLTIEQPGARTFLPMQLARHYISDEALPRETFEDLGRAWADAGFDLVWLLETMLSSEFFYREQFRGNLIKSPLKFYLGALVDLELDVRPFPIDTVHQFRQMGQPLWTPPNVRGWVGGLNWINSNTLHGRRTFVQRLFNGINEDALNADDLNRLNQYRESQSLTLHVQPSVLYRMVRGKSAEEAAELLLEQWVAAPGASRWRPVLAQHFENREQSPVQRLRTALIALFQSPDYQVT